jgi:hypothetical protein
MPSNHNRTDDTIESLRIELAQERVERQNSMEYYEDRLDDAQERIRRLKLLHEVRCEMSDQTQLVAIAKILASFKGSCVWDDSLCQEADCSCLKTAHAIITMIGPALRRQGAKEVESTNG